MAAEKKGTVRKAATKPSTNGTSSNGKLNAKKPSRHQDVASGDPPTPVRGVNKLSNLISPEPSFYQTVERNFERAAAAVDYPRGILDQIKVCNSVYMVRFPSVSATISRSSPAGACSTRTIAFRPRVVSATPSM